MATRKTKIQGITVEIGGDTTGLSKALQGVNGKIIDIGEDLKDVNRLLKLDPTNTELLRQKQELLAGKIAATTEKLDKLKEAEEQVQQQFEEGKVSQQQYDALQREIAAAEISIRDLKAEAEKTEKAVKGIDEKPVEEVADAADDAEKELKSAGKEPSNFGDYLKADVIVEGAKGIISSLRDVAEETKEYQKIMASLETSSERAGYSAQQTQETYRQLYGVLSDDQTAATTTANLQALGFSQEKLTEITNAAIGAWATYGDSIPIDSLAEAINETAKTGTVTGTLADALNWAGVSEDAFNEKLAGAGDATERANMILQQLASQGLVEAGEAWQKQNETLVESNQAQAEMQEQMAQLGETIQPIMTQIVELVSGALGLFNSLDDGVQRAILVIVALVAAIGPLVSGIGSVGSAMTFLVANPIAAVIAAIAAVVAAIIALVAAIAVKGDEIQAFLQKIDDFLQGVFAKDWTEVFGPMLGDVLNGFFANVKNIWDSIKKVFDGIIDFIRGVFTGDWQRAWNGIKEIFSGVFGGLVAIAKAPINGVIAILNGAINGINAMIRGLNNFKINIPSWVPGLGGKKFQLNISTIGNIPYLAKGGTLYEGSAVVGEAGPELLTMAGNRAVVQPLTNQTSDNTTSLGGVQIIVYGAPGQDVNELADIISERLDDVVRRKEAVYG